ncbi:MAG: hypothetical protein NT031_09670, partial [Planctomycetota bacterium]|nr:hypothetical protein [Planctomycetota bacterium]
PPPPLLAMLCENAYTLAAANTRGVETAVRAMNSLSARQPERQLACLGKIADVQRALYAEKTGLGKHAAGERLIETQSARADQAAAEDDYAAAVKADEDALAIAKAISSSRKDALLYTLKLFQTRQKSQAALEALKARLKANPADSPARADIIRLYIVEFDNPARAAAWLSEESNQLYRTYIPAAQEDPGSLPETLCLELGDWYSQHAEKASLDSRPPLLRRAMEYYEAFLAKHPAADSKRVKAKLTLDNLRPQLARSSLVPKPRGVRSRPSEPTGPAIGAGALVRRPVLIRGAGAWTIEPKLPRASLTVAALSPGGKCLALADASGGLRIYDALTGALTALLPGHSQPVTHLAWSQAGDTLASGDAEGKVCLWSIPSRRNLGVCGGHDGGVRALAWSADGTRLAAAG